VNKLTLEDNLAFLPFSLAPSRARPRPTPFECGELGRGWAVDVTCPRLRLVVPRPILCLPAAGGGL